MRYSTAICLLFSISACSGNGGSLSSLNPFSLFRGADSRNAATVRTLAPTRGYGFAVDTRPLVDQITSLTVEKTATGAIVRATALNPTQGYFDAQLVPVTSSVTGDVALQFRARPPRTQFPVGPVHLRQITAGVVLTSEQLRGVRRVTVAASRNSRTARP